MNTGTVCTQQWLDLTNEVLRRVFGTHMESIILPSYFTYYDVDKNKLDPAHAVTELNIFFDSWIELINDGLYKVDEKTFVDGFMNAQLRKWFISVAAFFLLIGYICGAYVNPQNVFHKMVKEKIQNTTGMPTK